MGDDFDPMDFQPNSVGVLVVRVVRLKDIMRTLGCGEAEALEVVREIRGATSADGARAFVLPSQLAAWTYRQAGRAVGPLPFTSVLVNAPSDPADALKRAATRAEQAQPPVARPPKSVRKKLILSKREAARLLGVGRNQTLHELIARGLLRTVVVNGQVKVPRADVERIAREGFDLDAPKRPARRAVKSDAGGGQGVVAAIRKLNL